MISIRDIRRSAMGTLIEVVTAAYKDVVPYFDELMDKLNIFLLQEGTY